eukprot:7441448-Lingulodinium_polyedra.AAC.1
MRVRVDPVHLEIDGRNCQPWTAVCKQRGVGVTNAVFHVWCLRVRSYVWSQTPSALSAFRDSVSPVAEAI